MNVKISVIYILAIILAFAIFVQISRFSTFEKIFTVNQEYKQSKLHYISCSVPKDYKKILVLYSRKDEGSNSLYNNIYYTFNMAKLNYKLINIESKDVEKEINKLKKDDLLVIGSERLYEIKKPQKIRQYIEKGGKVVFLVRSNFNQFNNIVGIKKNRGFLKNTLNGFKFEKKLFPGLDKLEITNEKIINSSLDVELNDSVDILATSENRPIIWTNKYKKGQILYINSTLMMDKANRGLLLQYISYIDDCFLSTIFNGKIVNIDDFPAPIKPGKDEVIYSQYNMDNKSFYKNIWWSSIYNIAKKYNIKYTGLVIGTYTNTTKTPLNKLNKLELEDIKYFGRKLLENYGEIGIHGYNHNSLALDNQINFKKYNYNKWESQKVMEKGLTILKNNLNNIYGRIKIYTYVPASNIISKEGKVAVKNVFKDIKIYAGLYTGEPEKGVLYQEFGKDPDVSGVYDFPRLSSGYHYNVDVMWDIYNGIAHYGIFNHFIHPDDILDKKRSKGNTWKEMEMSLEKIFANVYKNFGFLRPMTNIQAYDEYIKKEELKVYVTKKNNTISIYYDKLIPPAYHYLRLKNNKISKIKGGEFTLIDKNTNLYLIKGSEAKIEIKLK
ncbi:DUF2194 domain-containing protein [Tepidibacter thalassicus]|uniref:Uncharacterized protein n=1 Tax=Tepidibacter thalassicus DSM 15285 TaxID=1123350 RepID=A0A1M5NXQ8_9FIRM|nr:DUF2194 domain-containing protein [Tepidibacter thalassicus]SHG94356.1 hypothetical protein SAMN02744040_00281 [Tepidibacter thalassicus DSM 15285]